MEEAVYSIKDLEVLSGIKAHTIRIWEKRYQFLTPARTDTNIRYYCDEDLRRLLNIALLVKNGFRISKVANLTCEQIREEVVAIESDSKNESSYVDRLIIHMVNFDDISFRTLLDKIIDTIGIEDAISKIISTFFQSVGLYWQVGTIFPAQEHFVSNLVRQKLIVEIDKLSGKPTKNETILFYLHENELHELSLLFFAMMALKRGYKVLYLGQFVPLNDLTKIQAKNDINYIFTVFVNSIRKEELQTYLDEMRETFAGKKVFVSGRQLGTHQPKLPKGFKVVASSKDFNKYFGKLD